MARSFWTRSIEKILKFFGNVFDLLFYAGYLLLYCLVIGVLLAIAINGCQPDYSEDGHDRSITVAYLAETSLTL